MVKIRTRVNAVHPLTNKYAVGLVIDVKGYIIKVKFADGTIYDYHIKDVSLFEN